MRCMLQLQTTPALQAAPPRDAVAGTRALPCAEPADHPSPPALSRLTALSPLQVLWGECVSGALYIEDFVRMARNVGFTDPRVLSAAPIEINDAELKDVVGEAKFYSITYRCACRIAQKTC